MNKTRQAVNHDCSEAMMEGKTSEEAIIKGKEKSHWILVVNQLLWIYIKEKERLYRQNDNTITLDAWILHERKVKDDRWI